MGVSMKVNGRVAFLALKDQIETELEAGAFATRIYRKFRDQLGFSYTQFTRYLRQYDMQSAAQRQFSAPHREKRMAMPSRPGISADHVTKP